ncbi:MAG: DUF3784 domain-containing protein [Clostridia bacterium]|nr:DUF3784 domain-containing protein [Clostridia bacterium]
MIASVIVGLVGTILIVIGYLLWKKEKISLLHEYHYDKVSEADKKIFCILSGIGITLIGIGLLVTAVLLAVTNSAWSFIAFGVGFIAGLVLLIYAQNTYNVVPKK